MSTQEVKIRLALDGAGQLKTGVDSAAASLENLGKAGAKVGQQTQLSGQQIAQVSAQLQDLFIQIQGGGAPLTALLQQGSQLSAVFGGVGNALRAVGSLFSPVVVGLGAVAAAVLAGAAAYAQGSAEADAYRRAIVLTGNAAGVTVGELQRLAGAQDRLAGTQGQAAAVLAQLVASGRVARDVLAGAADAAIRLERAGGPAAEETAKKLAQLGKEPVQALLKLDEAEGFLTASLYKRVRALQESGQAQEAARVAQEGYLSELNGRTAELEQNLGSIERAWRGVTDTAKEAWDSMLGVGRNDVLQTAVQRTQKQLDDAIAVGDALAANEAQRLLERLQGSVRLENNVAEAKARSLANQREQVRLAETNTQWLSQSARLAKELADAQAEGQRRINAGLISQRDLEEKLAGIRDRYRDRGADAAAKAAQREREREQQLEREASLIEKSIGLSGNYYKSLEDLNKARQRGALVGQAYVDAVNALTNAQPFAVKSAKELAESLKGVADAEAAGIKLREQYIDGLNRGADAAAKQLQGLRDEEQAAAIAAAGNISLAQAIQQVAIARLQEQQAAVGADTEAAAAIEREIAARRELITLIGNGEARKAASDAAREAEREWIRTAQRIEDSLTDALLRGFESGKGFAQNLKDTVENMFRTMVLRPVIQMAFGGGMGMGGSSAMAGGNPFAGGGGSSMQSVQQFWNLLTGGFGDRIGASVTSGLDSLGMDYFGSGVAGSAAGALANGFAGYGISKALSGGYSAGSWVNTAAGIASAIPGIGPIAGVIGAAVNRAFGRKAKETTEAGLTGSIGGGDFTGQTYADWLQKGGWFRSDKRGTEMGAVDSDLEKALDMGAATLLQSTKAWAAALLLPAEQLDAVTSTFKVKLTDNEQENQKAIADLLTGYGTALTAGFSAQLTPFIRDGETASQTLERLAGSLTGVNGVLDALGQAALQASAQGGAYASALLEQFGGLQQFQSAAGQYLQDYYSQAERSALATQGLTQQLGSLGLSVPSTRDAYRQLVEAQDLSTEAGRKAYAALLQLAPTFAELVPAIEAVADVVDDTAQRMAEAGRRALEDLARDSGSLQVDLLRAQGDESAARALERDQALAAVRGKVTEADLAAITAAYDLNQAYRDQIDSARAAVEAQRAIEAAQKSAAESLKRTLDDLSGTRLDLEGQLLTAQGRDAEAQALARQRELEKLTGGLGAEDAARVVAAYELNEALRKQIAETNAANQAAQALADAQTRAAEDAARAANQFRDAWKGITDSLFDEVARIRGLFGASGGDSLASLQSRFAITTAQARAGDQEAAKLLPGLSQTLLQLAEEGATSLIDLQRIRAQVAGSLEQTGLGLAGRYGFSVPKLEVGTNYVPKDMLALLHEGEAVVPRAFNPAASGGENGQVVAELRAVQAELREMRARLDAGNRNTARVASAVEGNQSTPILVELAA